MVICRDPDLNGPTEILARLRGTQTWHSISTKSQHIKPALAEINQAWYEYWQACVRFLTKPEILFLDGHLV